MFSIWQNLYQVLQRNELLEDQARLCFVTAIRRICLETLIWRVSATGTLSSGESTFSTTSNSDKTLTQTVHPSDSVATVLRPVRVTTFALQYDGIYRDLTPTSFESLGRYSKEDKFSGRPSFFADAHGETVLFDRKANADFAVKYDVAVVPAGPYLDWVPLPVEMMSCAIEGALAESWMMGAKANPQMSELHRKRFLIELQAATAAATLTTGEILSPVHPTTPRLRVM